MGRNVLNIKAAYCAIVEPFGIVVETIPKGSVIVYLCRFKVFFDHGV